MRQRMRLQLIRTPKAKDGGLRLSVFLLSVGHKIHCPCYAVIHGKDLVPPVGVKVKHPARGKSDNIGAF